MVGYYINAGLSVYKSIDYSIQTLANDMRYKNENQYHTHCGIKNLV